ncbi:hypothetical protein ZWY2020_059255 [Hordeum vulgare]|nr:hypothetical protein ZWY2020_059255 [Hordeum vulgare]
MCINCGCAGHFRLECEVPPRCPTTLAYLGYETDMGSFYFVDAEIEEEVARPHLASVTLAPEQVLLPRGGWEAPRGGKLTHILKAISELVGKLATADLASFEDDGSVRIEILCPAPAEIDGLSLIFYFGTKGRRLTFELESPGSMDLLGPTPAATIPGDDGRDGDGGSSEESSFCEEDDDGGVPPAASDGRCTLVSSATGPTGPAGAASWVASGIEFVVFAVPSPVATDLVVVDGDEVIAGPPPVTTTAADLEIVEADVLSVGMEVCPSSSSHSLGVVCYSRLPGSPSSPALGSSDREQPPHLDLVMTVVTPAAFGPKARGGASPLVSARQSARLS